MTSRSVYTPWGICSSTRRSGREWSNLPGLCVLKKLSLGRVVDQETAFLIGFAIVAPQLLIQALFYFAALRRLLIPTSPSGMFFVVAAIVGMPGILLVFLYGWFRSRQMFVTRLMWAWTAAAATLVFQVALPSLFSNAPWSEWATAVLGLIIHLWLAVRELIPFIRADSCVRALMRESNTENRDRLVALGPQILPHLEMMLAEEYLPYRLDAIACLGQLGTPEAAALLRSLDDSEGEEAAATRDALEAIERSQA